MTSRDLRDGGTGAAGGSTDPAGGGTGPAGGGTGPADGGGTGPVDGGTGPASPALDQPFNEDGLYALRAAVSAHAADLGATGRRVDDLVVIANELASNAIRHGGGAGRLRLWRRGRSIICQVVDAGPGLADPIAAGRQRAPMSSPGGRGLWIVRQISQQLDVRTGSDGTTVTVTIGLDQTA